MKSIPHIESMRPEPKRDRWGRYILDGQVFTRQTTVAHTLDDPHGLTEWRRRMVLQGVATNPILLRDVPSLVREIELADDWRDAKNAKRALNRLCDDAAREAGAEDGSKLGTLLHTITEYADAGRLVEIVDNVPEDLLDDLAAYLVTMRNADIRIPPEYIERILVNRTLDAAGTTDRFVIMPTPCRKCGCSVRIADLKTQKSVDFGWLAIAIQLAGYAYADELLDPVTGQLGPMPDDLCRCFGLVMHLPVGAGRCDLYELDLIEGWEYAQLAYKVRLARSRSKQIGWPFESITRNLPDVRGVGTDRARYLEDQARYLVRTASHPKALEALWRDMSAARLWTDELTELAKARRAELSEATPVPTRTD